MGSVASRMRPYEGVAIMFLLLTIPVCVAVLVVLMRSRRGSLAELGTVSERWLTEHRAAAYELHR